MGPETQYFDLAGLRLSVAEARRMELSVRIEPLMLAGERYVADSGAGSRGSCERVPVRLEVSRMTGQGYALRLRFDAKLAGPCMRCLKDARASVEVDTREVDRPGGGEELSSPYVEGEVLDLAAWARDAFLLAVPIKVLCREDCAGLCPVCAADLNDAGSEHGHARTPDPRWAKLRELKP